MTPWFSAASLTKFWYVASCAANTQAGIARKARNGSNMAVAEEEEELDQIWWRKAASRAQVVLVVSVC